MLEEADAETVFALVDRNREYLRQWLIWVDTSDSPEVVRRYIKDSKRLYENKEAMSAGIWMNGELIGAIGVVGYEWHNRVIEIGYWLSADRQGKGIITRAVSALIDYAFNKLEMNRAEIHCATGNVAARLGVGFQFRHSFGVFSTVNFSGGALAQHRPGQETHTPQER